MDPGRSAESVLLVGGNCGNFGRNFQVSGGPTSLSSDEYDTAFFDKGPKVLHYLRESFLLKNIEFDHADIYADLEAIRRRSGASSTSCRAPA